MRPALARLLLSAGVPAVSLGRWDRMLVLRNLSGLHAPMRAGDEPFHDRGIHLLAIDDAGDATHYCKVRVLDAHPTGMPESRLLMALSSHARSAAAVPIVSVARDGHLEAQVTRFLSGERLDRLVPHLSPADRSMLSQKVLRAAETISRSARELPECFPSLPDTVSLAEEWFKLRDRWSSLNVPNEDIQVLERAARDVAVVPAITQHGDLWPKNVFREAAGSIRILDLDDYGRTLVPLFDAFHLVRTTDESARPRAGGPWLSRLTAADREGALMRAVLRGETDMLRMPPASAAGCLTYYLGAMTTHIHGRGAPEAFWARYRDEIPLVAGWLRESGSLAALYNRIFSA